MTRETLLGTLHRNRLGIAALAVSGGGLWLFYLAGQARSQLGLVLYLLTSAVAVALVFFNRGRLTRWVADNPEQVDELLGYDRGYVLALLAVLPVFLVVIVLIKVFG